tara:strand:- start:28 stop:144 length:117 start_codon:yes stop_codon:yes gene_type:complete
MLDALKATLNNTVALEDLTPWEYLAKHQQAENSSQRCN